ncbi:hypothetical protein FKN04_12375 [Bacillus glycinifermentans]|uniref:hypothetical protein n=1 Tax=Bacillus TaxID=1386 RepID=UPI00158342FE|nr:MULTISPECIES: hypothetical protein [Bacillus]NUJ17376.1 hypothetical protein [Bacillus glycinifermentans]GIN66336.1 hypothetical protein J41TS2_17570 [Bacillus sonorensis]
MAQKGSKRLSPAVIKKQVKKLNEVQEFVITAGEEDYTLTHDVIFRKSKIHKLLDDTINFFDKYRDRPDVLELGASYTTLLIIKHFTSLEVPDDTDKAIDLMEALIDLDLFVKIIDALPESEVVKVYEVLAQTVDQLRENLESIDDDEVQEVVDQIENEELKEMIEGNGEQDSSDEAE